MSYDYANRERAKAGLPSVEQEMEHLGLVPDDSTQGSVFGMQFAEPDYITPLNPEYRQELRFIGPQGFVGVDYSYPPCYSADSKQQKSVSIPEMHNPKWVDVSFWFAWACIALDVGAGAVLITGFLLAVNFPPLAVWMSFGLTVFFGSLVLTLFFRQRHRSHTVQYRHQGRVQV